MKTTSKFTHSVTGRNTPQNREWLEKLGYKLRIDRSGDTLCVGYDGFYSCYNFSTTKSMYKVFEKMMKPIVCTHSDELFRAVSAIREDSDYMQWFTDGINWVLCQGVDFSEWMIQQEETPLIALFLAHKATLEELIKNLIELKRNIPNYCYVCHKPLDGYGEESPLDGERVCNTCFTQDKYVNDNTDWT